MRPQQYRFQIITRPDRRLTLAPIHAGWSLTFLIATAACIWFWVGDVAVHLALGLEMAAWLYFPPLLVLCAMAFRRGAKRAALLTMAGGPLFLCLTGLVFVNNLPPRLRGFPDTKASPVASAETSNGRQ
jgi:hypothetical protein